MDIKMNPDHLRRLIKNVLKRVPRFYCHNAVEQLMMTAAVESDCGRNIYQLSGGPALGIMGVEPRTMFDNCENFLVYRDPLGREIAIACGVFMASVWQLEVNMAFNVLMARLKYWRVSEPLPDDVEGWAKYHEKHYNTTNNYPGNDWEVAVAKYSKFC